MRPLAHSVSLLSAVYTLGLQAQAVTNSGPAAAIRLKPTQTLQVVPAAVPPLPPAITQRLGSMLPRLQPPVRSWMVDQARRQRSLPAPDLEAIRSAARTRFALPPKAPAAPATHLQGARVAVDRPGVAASTTAATAAPAAVIRPAPPLNLSTMDIETLVQIVMAQCAKDAEADLKDMLNDMQKHQKQKAEMRAFMDEIRKERSGSRPGDTPCTSPNCKTLEGRLRTLAAQLPTKARPAVQPITTYGDLTRLEASLKGSIDSMDDMSEMDSMKLQMAMDRYSKLVSTLSNMMKKMSDTSDAIVANLK